MKTVLSMMLVAGSLAAQEPAQPAQPPQPPQPPQAGWQDGRGPGRQGPEAERLRMQVEERFGQMVKQQLDLNDQQMERLRTAMRANQDRRRDFMRREVDLRRAIQRQMQPGVAANNDSINRAMEQLGRIRVERAESDNQFMRDLNFLTPVQKARFVTMAQRMEERMREVRERRMDEGRPPRPMMDRERPQQPRGRQPL